MTPEQIVPVPYIVQRRAWECALVLVAEFSDRLAPCDWHWAATVAALGPETFTWLECRAAQRLYNVYVEARA